MILLALLKMKIDRNSKKVVHLYPSVSMFGFERVQFQVGVVASHYSSAWCTLYPEMPSSKISQARLPLSIWLEASYIAPKGGIFFFRCITYICCIGIRQMSLLDLLSSLHDELGRIEAAKSHCAGDAAVQYLLHPVLVSEPQLAQPVAVSLNARQPQLSPDTSSAEM